MNGKLRFLFWIGVGMLFLPYFGIPNAAKLLLSVAIGLILITLSFAFRREYKLLKLKLRRLEQPVVEQSIHTEPESPQQPHHE